MHRTGLRGGTRCQQDADERAGQRDHTYGSGLIEIGQQGICCGRTDDMQASVAFGGSDAEKRLNLTRACLECIECTARGNCDRCHGATQNDSRDRHDRDSGEGYETRNEQQWNN